MIWLIIGIITYIGTAALGTSAQLGLVNTRPFRWLHHALFAAVWLTLLLIVVMAWGQSWLLALLPAFAAMIVLPRFKAGTRPHCTCALVGMGSYAVTIVWALVAV
jgi:hypothetical protein